MSYLTKYGDSYIWIGDEFNEPCSAPFNSFADAMNYRNYIMENPLYFDCKRGYSSLLKVPPAMFETEKDNSKGYRSRFQFTPVVDEIEN